MLKINGIQMPLPTSYSVTKSDLDSSQSYRNELGVLQRNRIRQGLTKISVSWIIESSQVASILEATEPSEFTVEYMDPVRGYTKTKTMYTGDRSCKLSVYTSSMAPADALWEVSLSLVEY